MYRFSKVRLLGKRIADSSTVRTRYSDRIAASGGFTIVELLVVITIIGALVALAIPAIQSSRASSRTVQCANNLHQIGIGFHNHLESHGGKTPDEGALMSGLSDYIEHQSANMYRCPEVRSPEETSYYANRCVGKMLQNDSQKIILLDAHDCVPYEGADSAAVMEALAPRHRGFMNVLYFDGHVDQKRPAEVDPYATTNDYRDLWKPTMGGCSGICDCCVGTRGGLTAEYRPGLENFDGAAFTRIDTTLTKPFGGQYSGVQLPSNIPANQIFSGHWTGTIRPDYTGDYVFNVSHDDACSVRIDGKMVYQVTGWRWVNEGTFMASSPVTLTKGRCVAIEITLVNYGGPTHLDVQWTPPGLARQIIPPDNLFSGQ